MLVLVARQPEIGEGQKLVREVLGRSLLLTRHHGQLYAMDAHCFHMGAALADGDMEDVANVHPCIVCPAHRYRIDMRTGHKVDTDLCGNACGSKDQKQRIYPVFTDGDKIQVYVPDAPQQEAPLPSDKYNFWAVQQKALNTPPRRNMGLFGTADADAQPPTPGALEPYAGVDSMGNISLSQSPPRDAPQPAPAAPQQLQPQPMRGQAAPQGQIHFRAARARMAIQQSKYKPPVAEPQPAPAARGLFGSVPAAGPSGSSSAPAAAAALSRPTPVNRGLGPQPAAGQRTLQDLWGRPQQPAAVPASGPSDMDMD